MTNGIPGVVLGGSPSIPSTIPQYPWADGELLYAEALNAAIAGSGGAGSVYYIAAFGAKSDGVTDDSAAVNAAIAAASAAGGGKVILSAGRTLLGSSIAANIPAGVTLTIEGMGSGASELYFSQATDGLSFMLLNSGNAWGAVNLFSFSVIRGPTSPVMANTGINVYADPTANKTCGPLMSFCGLTVAGSSLQTNQWFNSISIAGLANVTFNRIYICGALASTVDQGDALLTIDGPTTSQISTAINLDNSNLVGGSAGVNVTRSVQGVFISNCVIIGQYDSIRQLSAVQYSSQELAVVNCSLNGAHRGVWISSVNGSCISNSTILRFISGVAGGFAGIEVDTCFLTGITNNNVIGLNLSDDTGILMNNCGTGVNTVIGNTTGNIALGSSIHLAGTTANTVVVGNATTAGSVVQDTLGNTILGNSIGKALSPIITNTYIEFKSNMSSVTPANSNRWLVGPDNTTESGSNSGNNFEFVAINDTGAALGAPIRISRANGQVTFYGYGGDLHVNLAAAAGTNRWLAFQTGTAPAATRWYVGAGGAAESGGNVGSDFVVLRIADDGITTLGIPLSIIRATGVVNINIALLINGGLGAFGATPPASKPTVTGAKGGNAALASLLTALASYGFITDSSGA